MKKGADSPIVRAKEAPRTAASNRRVDPFLVVLAVAVILVGFVVGRGMGATDNVVPRSVSGTQNNDAHASATFQPSAPPQSSSPDSGGQGRGGGSGAGGSGVGGHVVPVDPAYASMVSQLVARNAAVRADPSASPSSGHQLVELTSTSVSSTVGGAADALTQSLQSERARLMGAEAQLGGGASEPGQVSSPSPSPSPASLGGGLPVVGGGVPGQIPGGFSSPAPYQIPSGSAISVQMVPALDSDLSGDIRAQVEGDQCDPRTGAVVIADGSWLQGRYAGLGAARHLDFTWYRLTQPDWTYRDLSYVKTEDEEGHSGLGGKVATQRWAFFRDTLVNSVANAAGQIIAGAVSHAANVSVGNTVTGSGYVPTEVVPSLQDGVATPFQLFLQANYTVDSPYHGEFCR